jgi:hypothetical protein
MAFVATYLSYLPFHTLFLRWAKVDLLVRHNGRSEQSQEGMFVWVVWKVRRRARDDVAHRLGTWFLHGQRIPRFHSVDVVRLRARLDKLCLDHPSSLRAPYPALIGTNGTSQSLDDQTHLAGNQFLRYHLLSNYFGEGVSLGRVAPARRRAMTSRINSV